MKKLILHIGSHKTGSTSIQKALFIHAQELRKKGFNPILEVKNNEEVFSNLGCFFANNTGINCNFLETGAIIKNNFFTFLDNRTNISKTNIDIISSEEFSFITSRKNIESLYKELKKTYDNIKVIVYLRRQDRQLISHYQQASRAPGATSYIYGNEPVAIPQHSQEMDIYLNYYDRISMWGDIFGDENIDIVSFDKIILQKSGLIHDFFTRIGIDISVSEIKDNFSFGKMTTKVKHMSMQEGYSREQSFIFNKLFDKDKIKLTPSRSDATSIFNRYKESNEKLAHRFNLECDDFFDSKFSYPEISNETWTEEEANQVIRALLKLLKTKL